MQRPPEHFTDLEEKVLSRIIAHQLRFQYRADFLRATTGTDLAPITVQLRDGDLSYRSKQRCNPQFYRYGRITSVGGRVVQTFEDVISPDIPDSLFQASRDQFSICQKSVPLRSGLWRIDIVIKDTQSRNIGILGEALRAPRFDEDELDASSLILVDQIEPVAPKKFGRGQFVLDAYKVRPHLRQDFAAADKLGIYLQLYHLKLGEATTRNQGIGGLPHHQSAPRSVARRGNTRHFHRGGEQLTVERLIPVSFLPPGPYTIEVTAIDLLTNQTVMRTSDFTVSTVSADFDCACLLSHRVR